MKKKNLFIYILLFASLFTYAQETRKVISLNGTWQIAEGNLNNIPKEFPAEVVVPGYVDMATPAFIDVGSRINWKKTMQFERLPDPLREAFWYRKTFTIDELPSFAQLKISKAAYSTAVYLNGKKLGTRYPNFTPNFWDTTPFLKKGENEIIVRIGASLAQVPHQFTEGYDFEKHRYIPGIYDNVSLILTGESFLEEVQIAPNIDTSEIRVQGSIWNKSENRALNLISFTIKEKDSQKVIAKGEAKTKVMMPMSRDIFDTFIEIDSPNLWSPENPFLYVLEIKTDGDALTIPFGMRKFTGDEESAMFYLNNNPYYMRGTNITYLRFTEDPLRNDLPWNEEWIRKLFTYFKSMNWNTVRFCIGFPPEMWYTVADEIGILVQDEFPIWYERYADRTDIDFATLAGEYTAWIKAHCNYPSVVIFDPLNETLATSEMDKAKELVRDLDLSQRPWDNAWGWKSRSGDPSEWHPYRVSQMLKQKMHFPQDLLKFDENHNPYTEYKDKKLRPMTPPLLINEYNEFWINRDNTITKFAKDSGAFKEVLGDKFTGEEMRFASAHYTALLTEYWRIKKRIPAVLYFTSLTFSDETAVTGDEFLDIVKLTTDKDWDNYMQSAFSPIATMLDYYETDCAANSEQTFDIIFVNDTNEDWSGTAKLIIKTLDGKVLSETPFKATCNKLGQSISQVKIKIPPTGKYFISSQINNNTSSTRYLHSK